MAKCIGFQLENVIEAFQHMEYEVIHDYGDHAYGHYLYAWDEGKRLLGKCKKCGGYILIQKSEFHSFMGDDSYYTDYFPVDSEQEADKLNKKYDGYELEKKFPGKYMIRDGFQIGWMKGEKRDGCK